MVAEASIRRVLGILVVFALLAGAGPSALAQEEVTEETEGSQVDRPPEEEPDEAP